MSMPLFCVDAASMPLFCVNALFLRRCLSLVRRCLSCSMLHRCLTSTSMPLFCVDVSMPLSCVSMLVFYVNAALMPLFCIDASRCLTSVSMPDFCVDACRCLAAKAPVSRPGVYALMLVFHVDILRLCRGLGCQTPTSAHSSHTADTGDGSCKNGLELGTELKKQHVQSNENKCMLVRRDIRAHTCPLTHPPL